MDNPIQQIEVQSRIPTPVSDYGFPVYQPFEKIVVFDGGKGKTIRAFLQQHGCNPQRIGEFLRLNRIGSPFDLEAGTEVKIPS
jgi:hypothetical protein